MHWQLKTSQRPLQAHEEATSTQDGFMLRTMAWQGNIARALALKVVRDTQTAPAAAPTPRAQRRR